MKTKLLFAGLFLLHTAVADAERLRVEMARPLAPILPALRHEYGTRRPLEVCVGAVGIAVRNAEGIHVLDSVFEVINDDYRAAFTTIEAPGKADSETIALTNGLTAQLYSGPVPADRYAPELEPGKVRYLVSGRAGVRDGAVLVGASTFDGSAADSAILSRLHPVQGHQNDCVPPLAFALDDGLAKRSGFLPYSEGQAAAFYPLEPDRGPAFHCRAGIGFNVEAGESLRRPWRPIVDGPTWLTSEGVTIKITGPNQFMKRADPSDREEHPAGQLHETRILFYPSRGIGPPYAPPGVREDGSWLVELGKEQNRRLEISFAAGAKASVGFRFIERLEFVAKDDPRCQRP